MKVEYVAQKDDYGCAVACISMITGIPYDKVASSFAANFKREGLSADHARNFLCEHGFSAIEAVAHGYGGVERSNARMAQPFAPVHLVTVQSQADATLNHAIVMDHRGRIYDPDNPKRRDLGHYYCIVSVTGLWQN